MGESAVVLTIGKPIHKGERVTLDNDGLLCPLDGAGFGHSERECLFRAPDDFEPGDEVRLVLRRKGAL